MPQMRNNLDKISPNQLGNLTSTSTKIRIDYQIYSDGSIHILENGSIELTVIVFTWSEKFNLMAMYKY